MHICFSFLSSYYLRIIFFLFSRFENVIDNIHVNKKKVSFYGTKTNILHFVDSIPKTHKNILKEKKQQQQQNALYFCLCMCSLWRSQNHISCMICEGLSDLLFRIYSQLFALIRFNLITFIHKHEIVCFVLSFKYCKHF